jgi:hypothetical protein
MIIKKINSLFDLVQKEYRSTKLIGIILLCALVLFYLDYAIESILYPVQKDYGEGFILNSAIILSHGGTIYPKITETEVFSSFYPPIYYLLVAILIPIFGPTFAIGRAISVISTLIIALIIGLMVKRETKRSLLSAGIGMLFLISPYTFAWSILMRVDMLALLFSLLGIYYVSLHTDDDKIYFSIPFFLLAVYTKQTYFAAPIATFLYLMINNKKNVGLRLFTLFCAGAAIIFLILNNLTGGQFFIHTIENDASHGFSVERMIQFYRGFLYGFLYGGFYSLLLLLSFTTIFDNAWKKKISLPVIYFLVAITFSISIGKPGSCFNYLLESTAVLLILAGIGLDRLGRGLKPSFAFSTVIILGSLIGLSLVGDLASFSNDAGYIDTYKVLSGYLNDTPGRLLSEDAGLLVINNRSKDVFEFFVFSSLSRSGKWNETRFVTDIENRNFDLLLLHLNSTNPRLPDAERERYTEGMLKAIKENYALRATLNNNSNLTEFTFFVYEPNTKYDNSYDQ